MGHDHGRKLKRVGGEAAHAAEKVREVRFGSTPSDDNYPTWSFRHLDHEGPYGWGDLKSRDMLLQILERLRMLEGLNWTSIVKDTGSHNVSLAHASFCSEARQRLRRLQHFVDELFSLRVQGKPRIWGIKDGKVLRIIWWDPEHKICPSTK